jgi:hypothetical protein
MRSALVTVYSEMKELPAKRHDDDERLVGCAAQTVDAALRHIEYCTVRVRTEQNAHEARMTWHDMA